MDSKSGKRAATAGVLGAGVYAVAAFISPALGTVDPIDRPGTVVDAVNTGRIDTPLELSPMEIARIQPMTLVERLRVSGELRPINQAMLRAKSAGRITEIGAREGQAVKAGDVLVRFETDDLLSLLKQREADRAAANAERLLFVQLLDRVEQLARENVAPREQLDRAKAELATATARLDSLSAQVEIARTALRDTEVRAPFDGVLARLAISEGSHIGADAELVGVVDMGVLEARMLVSTRDAPRVAPGQPVELRVDGLDGWGFSANAVLPEPW